MNDDDYDTGFGSDPSGHQRPLGADPAAVEPRRRQIRRPRPMDGDRPPPGSAGGAAAGSGGGDFGSGSIGGGGGGSGGGYGPPPEEPYESHVEVRHVLNFKGKRVAVGLDWRLAEDSTRAREVAADWSKQVADTGEVLDLWCFNAGNDAQVGLGSTQNGHKSGMPSLGAEIASRMPGEWAGIFRIDGAFYVISARGGTIDRESDIAFIDAKEALKAFRDCCEHNVSKFYSSSELISEGLFAANSGIEAINIEDVIDGFSIRLRALSHSAQIRSFVVPILATIAGLYILTILFPSTYQSLKYWLGLDKPKEAAKKVVPPMPWTGQLKASEVIKSCLAAYSVVPLDAGGWESGNIICDGRRVAMPLTRKSITEGGLPIGWLLDSWPSTLGELTDAMARPIGKVKFGNVSGSKVDIFWQLPMVARWRESDGYKGSLDDLKLSLWKQIEERYESSQFPNATKGNFFQTGHLKVTTSIATADGYAKIFDVPSMTIASMSYDPRSGIVLIDARYHRAEALPPAKDIVRTPSPASLESGPNLPPPEK